MTTFRAISLLAGSLALALPLSAQTFLGSDNFNAAGPGFNSSLWNTISIGSYLTQSNGYAQFSNTGGAFNVDGALTWPTNASSHTYDWTATVATTLDYNGTSGVPSLGLFARPQEGGFFGVMLRGGQPNGTTEVFSSYATASGIGGAHIANFQGTVGAASTTTTDISDVLLRLAWDSSAGTLTSSFSTDAGASFITSAAITVSAATTGFIPANGFALSLYAQSGGVEHAAGTMYFDNFSVTASAIPEPSTYAALAGLGALGLACWRKRRTALHSSAAF